MRRTVGWTQRFFRYTLQVVLMGALFAGAGLADTRKAIANPDPVYPALAKRMNLTGTVRVELLIAADGSIRSAKVLGGHPVLADAVQRALKNWKYAPAAGESTIFVDFKF